jgi:hypothetical protein
LVTSSNGKEIKTNCWVPYKTIKQWVEDHTTEQGNPEQWKNATFSQSNYKFVCERLGEGADPRFPKLKVDSHLVGFQNGLYSIKDDKFITWDQWSKSECLNGLQCSRYFDHKVIWPDIKDKQWFQIHAPLYDKLLNDQKFTKVKHRFSRPHSNKKNRILSRFTMQ